jgi:large subunit ribosomal protein L4
MASAPVLGGGTVRLDESFEASFNMPLVHECVRAELNARRRGTASTKTRGQVSGGGVKPWRQKGTGRARAGSSRSPVWTGGGTVFGPTPRGYTAKVNRKARRAALRGALSVHAGRSSLAVFDASAFDRPSTAKAVDLLDEWSQDFPTLVLLHVDEADAGKSFRNIARVAVMPVEDAGVADVIGAASLLVSEAALPALVARAVGTPSDGPSPSAAPASPLAAKAAAKEARGAGEAGSPSDDAAAAAVAEPEAPEPEPEPKPAKPEPEPKPAKPEPVETEAAEPPSLKFAAPADDAEPDEPAADEEDEE